MLGIVAERFPKGGALSLNAVSAVGMMSVGIMGTVFLGFIQDRAVDKSLQVEAPALHEKVVTQKSSILGSYQSVDPLQVSALAPEQQARIAKLTAAASQSALSTTAIFPLSMLIGYAGLLLFFRLHGGYRAVSIHSSVGANSSRVNLKNS